MGCIFLSPSGPIPRRISSSIRVSMGTSRCNPSPSDGVLCHRPSQPDLFDVLGPGAPGGSERLGSVNVPVERRPTRGGMEAHKDERFELIASICPGPGARRGDHTVGSLPLHVPPPERVSSDTRTGHSDDRHNSVRLPVRVHGWSRRHVVEDGGVQRPVVDGADAPDDDEEERPAQ